MKHLRNLVRFSASPVFFLLAWMNRALGVAICDHAALAAASLGPARIGGADIWLSPSLASAIGGMWLMYALMGVFHIPPWLELLDRRGRND